MAGMISLYLSVMQWLELSVQTLIDRTLIPYHLQSEPRGCWTLVLLATA